MRLGCGAATVAGTLIVHPQVLSGEGNGEGSGRWLSLTTLCATGFGGDAWGGCSEAALDKNPRFSATGAALLCFIPCDVPS